MGRNVKVDSAAHSVKRCPLAGLHAGSNEAAYDSGHHGIRRIYFNALIHRAQVRMDKQRGPLESAIVELRTARDGVGVRVIGRPNCISRRQQRQNWRKLRNCRVVELRYGDRTVSAEIAGVETNRYPASPVVAELTLPATLVEVHIGSREIGKSEIRVILPNVFLFLCQTSDHRERESKASKSIKIERRIGHLLANCWNAFPVWVCRTNGCTPLKPTALQNQTYQSRPRSGGSYSKFVPFREHVPEMGKIGARCTDLTVFDGGLFVLIYSIAGVRGLPLL